MLRRAPTNGPHVARVGEEDIDTHNIHARNGGMPVLIALSAVLVLLLAAWSWRHGRLSDRGVSIVAVAWAPVTVLVYALVTGASIPFAVLAFVLVALPGALLYRTVFDLIRDQAAGVRK
jgi:hypothetical protein